MSTEKISIKDVAERAGVSVATVSQTINSNRPVGEATRRRVQEAMQELNYQPRHAAQALRAGSTNTIGVLVPDISNHFFAELALGVEQAAHARGFNVVLGNTGFDGEREVEYLTMIGRRSIDGLVYAPGAPTGSAIEALAGEFPIVLADEEIDNPDLELVLSDHFGGGQLIGQHFHDLGHRTALVITGPSGLRSSDDRLAGFLDSFPHEVIITAGDFRTASGEKAIAQHPAPNSGYSAVFALNDAMALGAIRALRNTSLAVPDDVSVAGYDDIPTAEVMNPALTTVRQPAAEIGRVSADRLLDQLDERRDPDYPRRLVLPVELAIRESTRRLTTTG